LGCGSTGNRSNRRGQGFSNNREHAGPVRRSVFNSRIHISDLIQIAQPDAGFRDGDRAENEGNAKTALSLTREVYSALPSLNLSHGNATRYYVQRQLFEFRLPGVDKDDAARRRLKKLHHHDLKMPEDIALDDHSLIINGGPRRTWLNIPIGGFSLRGARNRDFAY
jgi:hypothetical protein